MVYRPRLFYISLYLILLALLSANFAYGQLTTPEGFQIKLINEGFENVAVINSNDSIIVSYENRVYRYEVNALNRVIELTKNNFPEREIIVIPQKNNLPVCRIIISKNESRFSYNIGETETLLEDHFFANSTKNRFELILIPQLKAQFGNFYDPIQSQINFAPMLNINVGKGLNFRFQYIFPLQNKLGDDGDQIRPGIISLNQTIRFSNSAFLSLNVGHFTQDRIGFYSELYNYFLNDVFYFDLKAGYTGDSHFFGNEINFGGINTFTGFIGGGYWYSGYDLVAEIGYGKFLFGDTGLKVNIKRYFGEVEIGFTSILTSEGDNFGVNLSIPIFPSKYWKPSFVSVRPERYYNFKYKAEGFPKYGSIFETGGEIENFLYHFHPVFLRNHIDIHK